MPAKAFANVVIQSGGSASVSDSPKAGLSEELMWFVCLLHCSSRSQIAFFVFPEIGKLPVSAPCAASGTVDGAAQEPNDKLIMSLIAGISGLLALVGLWKAFGYACGARALQAELTHVWCQTACRRRTRWPAFAACLLARRARAA